MKTELTVHEKIIRDLAEKENPYDKDCPNRHLWNEGFVKAFNAIPVKEYSSQIQPTDEKELVKHFLLWYNTSIRERYFDDEHINYVLDKYFKSPRDNKIPTKD